VPARAIVEAPLHLGLRAAGVEALPEALLAAGLAERLGARHGTRVAIPAFDPTIDAGTGLLNPHGLRDHAARLADAVSAVLDEGAFPIVLGGDCTVLLGITLALRRRGRYGLLFLDGHADFYQPEAEPTGEAASMELALVTGRGPDLSPTSRADAPSSGTRTWWCSGSATPTVPPPREAGPSPRPSTP
jgi:arginase